MQVDAQLLPAPVVVDTKLKPAEMLAPLSQASEPSELPPPLPNVSGLVCPLCHEMLEDPVMAVDGHTYCRRCIQDWFQQTEAGSKPKSPVTGQPLLSLLLFPNLALGKALISIRTNMQPAWLQAEKERQALRAELDLKTRELIQAKAQSSGKDYSKDLTEAELNVAQLTAKLQIADEETRAGRGEVERLNKELGGLREKLERTQAQISGERSAMQQIDELDSLLRFSKAEVTRLQTELESVKKQETELRRGKYRYEIDMAKVTQENQKNQEELVRLRFQTQSQEGIPSSVVLAETLDTAKKDLEAKDTVIRELQLAGTRAGAQLVDLMEKQRQSEILLRRVPELEAENHALRQELNGKVAELSALKETLLQTEEKLRLREAAPELTAAELLASEAERLEEELAFAHDQLANWQVEFKKREDLLRGIPLVFADFLAQINAPDSALSSSNLRPEDAPRFVIAALQRLQLTMVKREEELKFAHEKIAELSQYAGSQGMSGSFIAKMAMLMYLLEVSVLSGSGLRDAKWKPSSNGAGLSCTVEIPGKEDKLVTKSIHTTKDPVWNHTGELQMSHSDSLCFTVQGEQKIGQAVLPASRAVVAGFEGDLKLNATETGLENAMIKVKIVVKMSFMAGENPRTGGSNGPAAKPSDPPKHPGKAQPSSTSNSGTDSDSSSSGSSAGGPKALLNAAKAGDLAQVSSLVKGAQAKDLTAALHAACSEGHRKLVAPLCKGKADVNGLDNSGLTPLHVAAFRGDDAVVQALCQLGANVKAVDEEGWTPLYVVAAFGGQEDVFKTLLAAKSDANFTTPSGTTISMAAKQKGFTQLLNLL